MRQITFSELVQLQQSGKNFLLIDVREPEEHERFNIGGKLIPLREIISRASEIPRGHPVVVYCRKGIRSQIAIQRLEEKFGCTNLVNLRGGIGDKPREEG